MAGSMEGELRAGHGSSCGHFLSHLSVVCDTEQLLSLGLLDCQGLVAALGLPH